MLVLLGSAIQVIALIPDQFRDISSEGGNRSSCRFSGFWCPPRLQTLLPKNEDGNDMGKNLPKRVAVEA